MTVFEKILVSFCVVVGSIPLAFVLYCLGAILWEQATKPDSDYPFTGFCPDSPSCYADYDAYNSLTPTP